MSAAMPSVSAIIVSYRSEEDLVGAVSCLPAWCEVVVVDQHAAGTAGAVAKEIRSDVRAFRSGANRGFGAGCNLGAANASGDLLLFLNPDARIEESGLIRLARTCVEAGGTVVGPRIVGENGLDETRARRWSSPYRDAATLLIPRQLLPRRWDQDVPHDDPRYREGGTVAYVQGSCFMVSAALFAAVGGFDERFFLYGEEETLARRILDRGLAVRLEPRAVAHHSGHTSTDKVAAFATQQLFRSRILRYEELGYSRALGAAVQALAVGVLWVSAPVRRRVGFRPLEDAEWCRAAMAGIRAGLGQRSVTPPT